jgi:hypothetical protein
VYESGFSHQHPYSTYSEQPQQQQAQPLKSAIMFSDAKLDDNAALTLMRYSNRYDRVLVVLNGVEDVPAAHGSMIDFHDHLEHNGRWQHPAEVRFIGGYNTLQRAAPHERHFQGRPTQPEHHHFSAKLMKHLLRHGGNKGMVDIWHMVSATRAVCWEEESRLLTRHPLAPHSVGTHPSHPSRGSGAGSS